MVFKMRKKDIRLIYNIKEWISVQHISQLAVMQNNLFKQYMLEDECWLIFILIDHNCWEGLRHIHSIVEAMTRLAGNGWYLRKHWWFIATRSKCLSFVLQHLTHMQHFSPIQQIINLSTGPSHPNTVSVSVSLGEDNVSSFNVVL